MAMTAKRRNKLRKLAEEIPVPEVHGDHEGTLMVGWGSTYGPIHDAVTLARHQGEKVGAIHLRHLHPLPNGLEKIFQKFKRIVTVEMNDQGVYGFGQLATILRARYCESENHQFHQDRWPHFSGERNFGRRIQGQVLPCAIHPARRRRRAASWYCARKCETLEGSRAAGRRIEKISKERMKCRKNEFERSHCRTSCVPAFLR